MLVTAAPARARVPADELEIGDRIYCGPNRGNTDGGWWPVTNIDHDPDREYPYHITLGHSNHAIRCSAETTFEKAAEMTAPNADYAHLPSHIDGARSSPSTPPPSHGSSPNAKRSSSNSEAILFKPDQERQPHR
jgi:hypothetical protein